MGQDRQTSSISIAELLEAGAHFGHQKSRWNPKMRPYIFEERDGVYIIDLAKTMSQIRIAVDVIARVVEKHGRILFVGTKRQAKRIIEEEAERCGEYYVSHRWLGGMLTNLGTIRRSVSTLERVEKSIVSGDGGLTKKEMTLLDKKQKKLNRNLVGIRGMRKPPQLLIVVDPNREHIAVEEARKLGIPIMSLVDTNCDPECIDWVIPCNDDSFKSISVTMRALADAVIRKKGDLAIPIARVEAERTAEGLGASPAEGGGAEKVGDES